MTIEDLVTYTRLREITLSPDGMWVTYLALRPRLAQNNYQASLVLQRTDEGADPVELAAVEVGADEVFERDTGAVRNFGLQAVWSLEGHRLSYTRRHGSAVELRLRHIESGREEKVGDFLGLEIAGWRDGDRILAFRELIASDEAAQTRTTRDPALRIRDDDAFWEPRWFRKERAERANRTLEYDLSVGVVAEAKPTDISATPSRQRRTYVERGWPIHANEQKSALSLPVVKNNLEAFIGLGMYRMDDSARASRDFFVGVKAMGDNSPPREFLHGLDYVDWPAWNEDGDELSAIRLYPEHTAVMAVSVADGKTRELYRTPGVLLNAVWAKDARSFVAVRQSPFMPDELVRVDVSAKQVEVMAAPNAALAERDQPSVRFMRVDNPLGGGIFGRLVLPNDYIRGKRYPLVFTTYRAGAGFLEGAVGDEFPILPYAAHGFVVFAMDTGVSNMLSSSGKSDFTLMREKRPVDAMNAVRRQLTAEGIVDAERCGITGLSYGSDIASYAIAATRMFKAASVSLVGLDPVGYALNPVNREKTLDGFGLVHPNEAGLKEWRKRSPALNAEAITTPVLIQSPDAEALLSVESFKAFRRHNVPVDWYVYPNEGHLKFQPLNKLYVYRRNLDWMRFWLQGEEDPDPAKTDQYARWRAMREAFEQRRPH